jgi:hypothetical protein
MSLLPKLLHIFTGVEWLMIVLVCISGILDIWTALLLRDNLWSVALPMLGLAIVMSAVTQGVWIKCMRKMVRK